MKDLQVLTILCYKKLFSVLVLCINTSEIYCWVINQSGKKNTDSNLKYKPQTLSVRGIKAGNS